MKSEGHARSGEILAVMGPSGCGKTTLLDILADVISANSYTGIVSVNGMARKNHARRLSHFMHNSESILVKLANDTSYSDYANSDGRKHNFSVG